MLLLGPARAVAYEFQCVMPNAAWIGMVDGRGLLWFVGDLRFGGLACLPGGDPIWWTGPPVAYRSPSTTGGTGKVIEGELARKAIEYAFDNWLP